MSSSELVGVEEGLGELYERVYGELHRLAHLQRRRWVGNDTLDTTSLVNECFIKLSESKALRAYTEAHFYAVAATAMRQILLDYAKSQAARKRGGDFKRVAWDEGLCAADSSLATTMSLVQGLERLVRVDARRARVFELRFFFGFGIERVAELLEISPATVKRDWTLAAAFLRSHLEDA